MADSSDDRTDDRPVVWTGHVFAAAREPKVAAEFYEAIGMRPIVAQDDFAVLELRGGTHLVVRQDADRASGPLDFDLMVEDIAATHAQWSEAGHTVSDIESGPIHQTFTLSDPEGNTITVFSTHVIGPV